VPDEAVSAPDVSIPAQVLNLITGLRDEISISFLSVTHNLAVTQQVTDEWS
jgi:ABC-type oligopeptide transport system ATPase subunit